MNKSIITYHEVLEEPYRSLASRLYSLIQDNLPNATVKIWHAHPVWFLEDNPIVGYSMQKKGLRLMFWSGADFSEAQLNIRGKKFKDASIFYNNLNEINAEDITRWLKKAINIQWDYKNIIKRKGVLLKIE